MATKLPAFQFYPGDWQKEPTLRCITHAAKGVFVDMLCLMFECEDRGVLASGGKPWTDDQISAAVGGDKRATLACIDELLAMGVVSRNEAGAIFSRRMVRDEYVRQQANGRQRKKRSRDCHAACHGDVTPLEGEVEDEDATEVASKKKGKRKYEAGSCAIPCSLDVPEFHVAWKNWIDFRAEIRKPYRTERGEQQQLARLESWGTQRAIAAIMNSIANEYQGIFEPSERKQSAGSPGRTKTQLPKLAEHDL